MNIGRSILVGGVCAIFVLGMLGCGEEGETIFTSNAPRIAKRSFDIGKPQQFKRVNVYDDYVRSKGVYLVSNHGMLVALAAQCTNDDHKPTRVRYDSAVGVFKCVGCGAKFTRDGLNRGTSQAKRPLERCRIRHAGPIYDPEMTLVVDPNKRYLQDENEWSKHTSFFALSDMQKRTATTDASRERERLQKLPPLRRN